MTRLPIRPIIISLLSCGALVIAALLFVPTRSEASVTMAIVGLGASIGAIVGLGKLAKSGIDDSISDATDNAKNVLREASERIDGFIAQTEASYGHALDTTLASLDTTTGQQMAEAGRLFEEINRQLMSDAGQLSQTALELIEKTGVTVQQATSRLEDLTLVVVGGATFLIDKATFNTAFLLAAVLLAIGLLLFARMLWTRAVPSQGWVRGVALGGMATYVLVFGALLLPEPRAWAVTMAGQANKLEAIASGPKIFSITPQRLVAGEAVDIVVIGAHFGDEVEVKFGGKAIKPQAVSDTHLHLHVELPEGAGPKALQITTESGERATATLQVEAPPRPPEILSWSLNPSGKAWHLQTFPDKPTRCSIRENSLDCDMTVQVNSGWELAKEALAEFDTTNPNGSVPNPAYGFVEKIVHQSPKKCWPHRYITYYPPGKVDTKTGISVKVFFPNAMCIVKPDFKFDADYSVKGRKLIDRNGKERRGTNCEIVGKVTCDTYPAKLLREAEFQDERPERFDLWVEVQTASASKPENFSKTFTMGTSREKLVLDGGLEIWIEETNGSYALKASGPGSLHRETPYIKLFDKQMLAPQIRRATDVKLHEAINEKLYKKMMK